MDQRSLPVEAGSEPHFDAPVIDHSPANAPVTVGLGLGLDLREPSGVDNRTVDRRGGGDRRDSTSDRRQLIRRGTSDIAPGGDSSLISAIRRFGSRFDFRAMAAFQLVGDRLQAVELWNPDQVDADQTNPATIAVTPAFEEALNSRASGPRTLIGLDAATIEAMLAIPEAEQAGLSILATRLELPDGLGLLLGARQSQESQLSLNFNRTLRDLGWLITQLIARRDAEHVLTVQLRLQDTLRKTATGFLSVAPEQRGPALRESLWRFGTAVAAQRLALWLADPEPDVVRLEAQYSSEAAPIVPRELSLTTLQRIVPDQGESSVIFGRDLDELELRTTRGTPALEPHDRLIVVPLREGRRMLGYLVAVIGSANRWSAAHTSGVDSLGSLLISFLARIENEQRFDRAFSDGRLPVTWRRPTGELIRCNDAFLDFIGTDSAYALLGTQLDSLIERTLIDPDDVLLIAEEPGDPFRRLRPPMAHWSSLFAGATARSRGGRVVSFHVRHGADPIILSHIEDITATREQRDMLQHQATHDELTGLHNRRGLLDELNEILADDFDSASAAVLLIDLDRFKVVNDSLGHAAGDELLVILAQRLRSLLAPGDVAARLGGDEFVVVLRGPIEVDAVRETAELLLSRLSGPVELGAHEVYTSISLGIAFPHPGDAAASDVLRHADAAMYEAKKSGRNCFKMFDQRTRSAVARQSSSESELRRALESGDFVPHFQPEFSLVDHTVVGLEALVRWPHPQRGILSADEIVPLAEETGLIGDLGALILDRACRAMAGWRTHAGAEDVVLRVNVSASQLQDHQIVDAVVGSLSSSGLPAVALSLEVTETALMRDPKQALRTLNTLVHDIGVSIAVDDFGTGFSSLAYLQRLPVKSLKIDQEFIELVDRNAESAAIISTIVALADSLNLEVIAEGIETADAMAALVALGVTRGQGFHLSPPLDHDQTEQLLLMPPRPIQFRTRAGA